MNKEEQENMFKMFLNFLDGHGYDNEIPAEYFKTDLFKSNNYYDWLETYQKLTSDHNTCDLSACDLSEWIETVNNIKQWNIEYESDDIFYSNDCKYERIIGNCAKCSCQDLRNFPCSVLLCSDTKSFKLINNESKGKKFDSDKLRYDLIPPVVDEELAKILTFGAKKYGENNWQKLDNFNNRYYAAARRHLEAWRSGEDIDPESGEHHLSHALTNLAFLVWNNVKKKNKL